MTEEVLITTLAKVESMLNARPLVDVSVDPRDETPLTPNHFLGGAIPHIPPDHMEESCHLSRRRENAAQELANRLWRKFLVEYATNLMAGSKWTTKDREVQVGDLVLIVDKNLSRGTWPSGRVTQVLPSVVMES